jgi:hypothetical protein
MKFGIILLSLLFVGFTTAENGPPQQKGTNYLNWTDGKLSWKNFKGKMDEGSPYIALTFSAIDLKIEGLGDELAVSVNTVFDPRQSWKDDDQINDYLLAHEQLHFDITEYHSRLLREKIAGMKFKSFEDIADDIQNEFNAISNAAETMQEEYDGYTDHSKVKVEQLKWNTKVQDLLDSKKNFTEVRLLIDISYLK